jgi:hypothetical protein
MMSEVLIYLTPVAAWIGLACVLRSKMSGWSALAKKYTASTKPPGKQFKSQSARIGRLNYGSCLSLVVAEVGLYVSTSLWFRIGHPPLMIPWSEFSGVEEKKRLLFFRNVRMNVGDPVITTVELPLHVIQQRPI